MLSSILHYLHSNCPSTAVCITLRSMCINCNISHRGSALFEVFAMRYIITHVKRRWILLHGMYSHDYCTAGFEQMH